VSAQHVTLLNASYEPLGRVTFKHAVRMLFRQVDHVLPQSRGGESTWLNAVAACAPCNHRKANRTPAEAGLRLRLTPYAPTRAQLAAR